MEKTFLTQLEWRFTSKNFDPSKKVSEENLAKILIAIRMAPTSYGLEPFHVVVVTNEELRKKLQEKGFNQAQFTEASHLLVFASRTDLQDRITQYLEEVSGGDAAIKEKMSGLESMMRGGFEGKSVEEIKAWSDRQTYIALGFALAACAEIEVDSSPMEGFMPGEFDKILELPSHMKSVVVLGIGYRKEDPPYPKFRFGTEDLFSETH
ncbi:MAG: NAD(P)H-dependent oxidoreductase [Candidatus Peregrinibacteria bacterium]|nr:NAD(P)H-dependent oxidoreductase [Candidatus Peregrinibacteria bacterium]